MVLRAGSMPYFYRSKIGMARLLLPALLFVGVCSAQDLAPRSQWQASSSSQQVPAMAVSHLIDGDAKTVTGGAFSPGHGSQIDVGHRLRNTGSTPVESTLTLAVRPMQMNPPWQNGGLSPIRDIAIEGPAVHVNGRPLLQSLTPVGAAGAAPFGRDGESEISTAIATGLLPSAQAARDADGLAAAALAYRIALQPGDGHTVSGFDADGLRLSKPFRRLEARW